MKNVISLLILLLGISCGEKEPKVIQNQNSGGALGTSYSIIYQSEEELNFQKEIDSVFAAINQSMSTYIPSSDISKINDGDTTVIVDHMFKEVFELSKEIYKNTEGYFDPTVGILVNAWGFGPGAQLKMDSTRVDSLMNYVGFDKVELTNENKIQKVDKSIRFDFNAIAKGYAIDRLAVLMDQKGITNYLLEVGGEVVAKGENQIKNKAWATGIEDPENETGRSLKNVINLKNNALASSGNYRKFRIDSVTRNKYVHTINPKTGYTKSSKTLGANVIAKSCAEADAYATAFMAMDFDDVIKLLDSNQDLDAYIIYLNEAGESQEFMTEGFKQALVK